MGQNKVYTSTTYGHPEASQAAKKSVVKSTTALHAAASTSRSGHNEGNLNKKTKMDVWGPVYQNRQHFIDMHIC